ncbi:hypothetical protein KXW29_003941 [Aspergillus fumigatus]|nr:hypothetical protein KXW29_003941 [Aspergillus fumigatus]
MEKSLSHSEQEERDGDSDSATGSPPIFQSEYLSSEPLFRGGSSTITAKASDRLHGPPSTLAKCHCRSIFATTSRAGDKPQSILQSPTAPACGLSSIDLSRTCSREGMAILGSNVAPSSSDSPSHMRMKPLHQHPTITSALLAETLPAPGQQNVVGTSSEATNRLEQNHLGSAPVQSDAVREENHAQTLSALRTELSFQEHSTIATLSLLEVAEPSSSSQPTLVVMTGTSTEPVYSSVSSIRVHLYHASEQLAGMVQGQESPVSDIEGVLITHLASNAPSSPTGAIPGLQGSVGSQISSPLPTDPVEGPPTTRMWSVSMSTSHLRTSTTITDAIQYLIISKGHTLYRSKAWASL